MKLFTRLVLASVGMMMPFQEAQATSLSPTPFESAEACCTSDPSKPCPPTKPVCPKPSPAPTCDPAKPCPTPTPTPTPTCDPSKPSSCDDPVSEAELRRSAERQGWILARRIIGTFGSVE